jgi:hypothetical protein
MKKIKIDWLKAKEEFLLDSMKSLKDIAYQYNFSYSKIRNVSAKRGWFEDKKQIQRLISEALMKEIEFKVTDDLLEQVRKIKPSMDEKYLKRQTQIIKRILRK